MFHSNRRYKRAIKCFTSFIVMDTTNSAVPARSSTLASSHRSGQAIVPCNIKLHNMIPCWCQTTTSVEGWSNIRSGSKKSFEHHADTHRPLGLCWIVCGKMSQLPMSFTAKVNLSPSFTSTSAYKYKHTNIFKTREASSQSSTWYC